MDGSAQAEYTEVDSTRDLRALPEPQQRRLILEMVAAGSSDGEIGNRFALSAWQVRNLRYRLGLKKDRGGHIRRAPGPDTTARAMRLPRLEAGSERLGVRMAGVFEADDAGSRLSALGGLLSASEGRYEVRVAVYQLGDR